MDREPARTRPWWLAAAVAGLGGVCLYGASSLPGASRYSGVGPGFFPTAIGIALIVLGALLAVQIARGERFEPQDTENAGGTVSYRALGLAFLAAFLPIFLMKPVGLPLTATLSFALVARAFGSRRFVLDIATGAIVGSVAWLLFDRLGLQLGGFFPPAGV